MKHLFRPEERNAVEDRYGDNPLFEAMRTPCLSLMNQAKPSNEPKPFALHPCELFYHVLYTIDDIKSKPIAKATTQCDRALWDDLLSHMRDRVGDECFTEAQEAAGMIMYVTALIFFWSDSSIYTSMSGALIKRVSEHLPGFSLTLYRKFAIEGFNNVDKDKLCQSINDYLTSNRSISAEIEDLLDAVTKEDSVLLHEDNQTAVNIATRKKTSVVVVLEAMYKAGWLVDANGKRLTNRNKTIAHILETAFGERGINIDQLLSSVKNRSKEKGIDAILNELKLQ